MSTRKYSRPLAATAIASLLFLAGGCTLYNDVSITPLILLPTSIDRGSDLQAMLKKADYLRAIELTTSIEGRQRRSANDLAALGAAELASGRYDAARQHLRAAIDLNPFRTTASKIAWDLSQVEFLCNNYETSLEWARLAQSHGLQVKEWHLEYLTALQNVQVYDFSAGQPQDTIPMRVGRPDVPRIDVHINGERGVNAVIDSGAVLSIISNRLANSLKVRRLDAIEGTFYGLLGEPIKVGFALLEELRLGEVVIKNVPVAVMPDDKMEFLMPGKKQFSIDFLLGLNLLKEFRIELDYRRHLVTFSRLTTLDRNPVADQNLFIEGFRPMVRSTVNRRGWYMFILDTGSEVTFLNDSQLVNLPVRQFGQKMHGATLQGLGGAKKSGVKMENVEIGVDKWAGVFKNVPIYTSSSDSDRGVGIIGENFLRNFLVTIDFGRMRVDLER